MFRSEKGRALRLGLVLAIPLGCSEEGSSDAGRPGPLDQGVVADGGVPADLGPGPSDGGLDGGRPDGPRCGELDPFNGTLPADRAEVVVEIGSTQGPVRYLQGFLNGLDPAPASTATFDEGLIRALRPRFWRIGTGAGSVYPRLQGFGPTFTVVLSDLYADFKGSYARARPFDDWAEYEGVIAQAVTGARDAQLDIGYWEVWGEPQGGTPWLGSYDQLLELYDRTYRVVKGILPAARVIGPAYDDFEGNLEGRGFGQLLLDLDQRYGVRLEAISWHELGAQPPRLIPEHAARVREFVAAAFPGSTPELHVNEFANSADSHFPGATVAWLYYLMAAQIDVATRACWPVPAARPFSGCWAGLNGLLLADNRTPTPIYWVHRAYADFADSTRLVDRSSDERNLAIAAVDQGGTVRVLLGRWAPNASQLAPLALILNGLDGRRYRADVTQIDPQVPVGALVQPLSYPSCELSGTSSVALRLSGLSNGAALSLTLSPVP